MGGKVAVDLPQGKNLVGAFYHPKLVLIDPQVLRTLPPHFIMDGMGEVIKYGCIKDAALFSTLKEHGSFEALADILPEIIFRCVDIKRQVVEADQFDTGERMLLNFGHRTLSPIPSNNIFTMSGKVMEKPSESACIRLQNFQRKKAYVLPALQKRSRRF